MATSEETAPPGNAMHAERLARLSNPDFNVTRRIVRGCGPSTEQIHWAVFHPSETPPKLLLLTFRIDLNFGNLYDFAVMLEGIHGIYQTGPVQITGFIWHDQVIRIFGCDAPKDTRDRDVWVSYSPREREGWITFSKDVDERVHTKFREQKLPAGVPLKG